MARQLSPYEKNQLLKFDLSSDLSDDNQTPVEYLTGHVDFCGHDFLVTHHTLIPRVETQEIVDLVIHDTQYLIPNTGISIADIGTGSGALGISLSLKLQGQNIPHQLTLSDVSLEALTTTRLNALRLLPQSTPTILQSDLFTNFSNQTFDIITANLPYIPTGRITTLDTSVKDYEPHLALDGGPDGALVINQLLSGLEAFTNPQALVILEIDHTHTKDHFHIPEGFKAELLADSYGQTRFLKLTRGLES